MPRKKLARRFEPRFGVNQVMLDTEVKWVQRELDDHLLLSLTDLHKNLADVQLKVARVEATLQLKLRGLPDRERLALKGMIARDVLHIGLLYQTFLQSSPTVEQATGVSQTSAEEVDQDGESLPVLLFPPSLFE
jgi:hypothetical protein